MRIDLNKFDRDNFKLKEGLLSGHIVYLINPIEFNCKWNKTNLCFRSMLVDFEGNILSRGFDKFFNYLESTDLYPNPEKYKDWVLTNKEDGSLMICDCIYENLNVRTRGTFSYIDHNNTQDFDYVINKYNLFGLVSKYKNYSLLFEIYSPSNVIVLKPYSEPEIVFLGAIEKNTGEYHPFYSNLGKEIQTVVGCKVPEIINLVGDILTVATTIKSWEGKEGIVLNFANNQYRVKLKSDWYLIRHRMKSELSSLEKVVDFWISLNYPSYQDFYNQVINTFDYEIAEIARPHISNICDGYKEVKMIVAHMESFVAPLRNLPRKDAAIKILSAYGETNRKSFCFNLLDNKPLDGEAIKKLMFQVLKK